MDGLFLLLLSWFVGWFIFVVVELVRSLVYFWCCCCCCCVVVFLLLSSLLLSSSKIVYVVIVFNDDAGVTASLSFLN